MQAKGRRLSHQGQKWRAIETSDTQRDGERDTKEERSETEMEGYRDRQEGNIETSET